MVSREVSIVNRSGLNLAPAGKLCQTAMRFKSDIYLLCGDRRILAKSVLNLMAAGIACGDRLTISCSGVDEDEALKVLCEAVRSGFGEEDVSESEGNETE